MEECGEDDFQQEHFSFANLFETPLQIPRGHLLVSLPASATPAAAV